MSALPFDHAGLNVADLPGMRDWYAAALGLEVEYEFALTPEQIGAHFSGAMLRSPLGYRFELLHRPDGHDGLRADVPVDAVRTRGYGHVAFTVTDLEATYAALLAAGATERLTPRPSPEPGVRVAFVADPEGNLLELVERVDGTR